MICAVVGSIAPVFKDDVVRIVELKRVVGVGCITGGLVEPKKKKKERERDCL